MALQENIGGFSVARQDTRSFSDGVTEAAVGLGVQAAGMAGAYAKNQAKSMAEAEAAAAEQAAIADAVNLGLSQSEADIFDTIENPEERAQVSAFYDEAAAAGWQGEAVDKYRTSLNRQLSASSNPRLRQLKDTVELRRLVAANPGNAMDIIKAHGETYGAKIGDETRELLQSEKEQKERLREERRAAQGRALVQITGDPSMSGMTLEQQNAVLESNPQVAERIAANNRRAYELEQINVKEEYDQKLTKGDRLRKTQMSLASTLAEFVPSQATLEDIETTEAVHKARVAAAKASNPDLSPTIDALDTGIMAQLNLSRQYQSGAIDAASFKKKQAILTAETQAIQAEIDNRVAKTTSVSEQVQEAVLSKKVDMIKKTSEALTMYSDAASTLRLDPAMGQLQEAVTNRVIEITPYLTGAGGEVPADIAAGQPSTETIDALIVAMSIGVSEEANADQTYELDKMMANYSNVEEMLSDNPKAVKRLRDGLSASLADPASAQFVRRFPELSYRVGDGLEENVRINMANGLESIARDAEGGSARLSTGRTTLARTLIMDEEAAAKGEIKFKLRDDVEFANDRARISAQRQLARLNTSPSIRKATEAFKSSTHIRGSTDYAESFQLFLGSGDGSLSTTMDVIRGTSTINTADRSDAPGGA